MPALFFIVFIHMLGFGIIIPLLPFYAERFQASPDVVAVLMATYSMAQFVTMPLWGRLSDRVGRRPVLLISLAGAVFSYVWLGFAESLWMLFAARALGGAMAGNVSAAYAYVADVTTPANRARGMGIIGAAFGLGFVAGPAIGGILAGADPATADFQTPALAAAALSTLAMILALVLLEESLSPDIRGQLKAQPFFREWLGFLGILRRPGIGLLMSLIFLTTFVFAGMEATLAMWSERQFGWGPLQNGYLFAYLGILIVIVQGGLMGRLARRFGETRLVVQGTIALAVGFVAIPMATNLPVLLLAMAAVAYGFSVVTPSLNSLISLGAGREDQGGIMGAGRSVATLARVAGPVWAGFLFSTLGRDWPYLGAAVVALGAMFIGLKVLRGGEK